jgi:hypothetical protein
MREQDLLTLQEIVDRHGGFGHREHLELAWSYLSVYGFEPAYEAVAAAIRHIARKHGEPDRYHATITRSWLHLVAVHRQRCGVASFDEFIAENPGLLDRSLLGRHYSSELIRSARARARWVEPDLRALPAAA